MRFWFLPATLVLLLAGCGDDANHGTGGTAGAGGIGGTDPTTGGMGTTGGSGGTGASGGAGGDAGAGGGSGGGGGMQFVAQDWVASYEPMGGGYTRSLTLGPNDTFVIGGTLWGYSGHAFLAKIAADGAIVWQHDYGVATNEAFFEVKAVPGGGYAALGYDIDLANAIRLIRVDETGTPLWEKNYASAATMGKPWIAFDDLDLDVLPNGGFAIGHLSGLIRTDANGTITSQFDYDADLVSNDVVRDVVALASGDVVLLGSSYAMRVDAAGTVVWAKDYTGGLNPFLLGGAILPNGHIAAVGSRTTAQLGALVMQLDGTSGSVMWAKVYADLDLPNFATAVRVASNGELLVAGLHVDANAFDRAWWMRLNSNGDLQDAAIYPHFANDGFILGSSPVALPVPSGGIVLSPPKQVGLLREAPNSPDMTCPLFANFKSFVGGSTDYSVQATTLNVTVTASTATESAGATPTPSAGLVHDPVVCP